MPDSSREDFEASIQELSQDGGSGSDSTEEKQEAPSRERDDSGRFAPRTPARDPVPENRELQPQVVAPEGQVVAPAAPGPRAPITWKPEEREGWDAMPPHHKAAIQRRELEMQQALSGTVEARRAYMELQQMVQPYMHMIQAEGSTPMRAVASMLQTAAALRTSPPGQRAQLVADLIMQYGIDPQLLDTALAARVQGGQPAPNPNDQIYRAIDQRLQPVTDFMNRFQQQQDINNQHTEAVAVQSWQEFANDPQNEFANDLSNEIGDLLELAAKRGRLLSLPDAYRAATLAHPTISQLVQRRSQAVGTAQQDAAARRALNAAASISSGNAPSRQGNEEESDGSIRGDLLSSIRTLSARRQ